MPNTTTQTAAKGSLAKKKRANGKKPDNPSCSRRGQKTEAAPKVETPGSFATKSGRLNLVQSVIDKMGAEMAKEPTKTGVAELIRLLALEKELAKDEEMVREIRVTWVEPTATESSK